VRIGHHEQVTREEIRTKGIVVLKGKNYVPLARVDTTTNDARWELGDPNMHSLTDSIINLPVGGILATKI
jgi:hypothetical protein